MRTCDDRWAQNEAKAQVQVQVQAQAQGAGEPLPRDSARWTHGWRRVVLANGMLVYPGLAAVGVSQHSHGAGAIAGYVIVAAFCAAYLGAIGAVVMNRQRRAVVLMGVLAVLFLATLPFAHEDAFFLATVIVAYFTAFRRRYAARVMVVGTLGALLVPWAVRPWHTGPAFFQALGLLFSTLVVGAFAEIAETNRALVAARAEVARLASEAERNRIARDLHDLLGHSLTAITVKSRLAQRLAPKDLEQAQAEMAGVEGLSRQALADVRAAVSGYREVTLAAELARGRELLRAAGVVADLPTTTEMVAAGDRELFGWVVREGLTNVVRHSRATRCTVAVTASSVEIGDDGVGGAVAGVGKGLTGLRERVAAAGGTVEAGPVSPHGWWLRVRLGRDAV
ncbi:histidine kinase [Kitasatospora sp. RB6PN24]|uniref:sensor histidine kinase n=1 Tax=Kitasatospora humi TaxID=2893891 RepID=UPI001E569BB5|nr:histidine kinase [Kitasatospora humi]MCC9308489.1 histidine kinase [Kitasatospora humi]